MIPAALSWVQDDLSRSVGAIILMLVILYLMWRFSWRPVWVILRTWVRVRREERRQEELPWYRLGLHIGEETETVWTQMDVIDGARTFIVRDKPGEPPNAFDLEGLLLTSHNYLGYGPLSGTMLESEDKDQ